MLITVILLCNSWALWTMQRLMDQNEVFFQSSVGHGVLQQNWVFTILWIRIFLLYPPDRQLLFPMEEPMVMRTEDGSCTRRVIARMKVVLLVKKLPLKEHFLIIPFLSRPKGMPISTRRSMES